MKVKCEICGKKTLPYEGVNLVDPEKGYNVKVEINNEREIMLCQDCIDRIVFRTVFQHWTKCGRPVIAWKEERNG